MKQKEQSGPDSRDSESQQSIQLEEITRSIISMAQLDFSSPPSIRGTGPIDAVAQGLVALGEELQASLLAQKEAVVANEAKSQFLANMSHELRTPLTTISGCIELLDKTDLSSHQAELLRRVQLSTALLTRLISDVLDFSTLEAGTLGIEIRPFRLQDVLAQLLDSQQIRASEKNLTLRETRDDLPSCLLMGDADRLQQVLTNLVDNAIKYTEEGYVEVRSQGRRVGDHVVIQIEVHDTGPGIPDDQQERVFERFRTGDASIRRRKSGAGLGLSISRSLIEAMGGELTLSSQLKQGSCFQVHLRLRCAPDQPTSDQSNQKFPAVEPAHILVVEDTELVRDVTFDMLCAIGYTVETAASGHEALAKVAFHDYDLILMDCQMPLMDGLETSRRLLDLYPERKLRIVAITAHGTAQDRLRSLEAGMVGHLTKPFTLSELRDVVGSHLSPSLKTQA